MKAIGMGTAGADMAIKYLPSGDAIGEVNLAVRTGKKDADGKYITQWYRCALFGKRAESLAQYITKGSKHCYALADVVVRQYQTTEGEHRVSLEARIEDVEFGGKNESAQIQAERPALTFGLKKPSTPVVFDDLDSDLPF